MNTTDNSNKSSEKPVRDRKLVEGKLIASACQLLSALGPKAVTIRDIAKDAGVNHGQIHHYFGGKKGLLTVAMHHLAQAHAAHTARRVKDETSASPDGSSRELPPLGFSENTQYQMAILRCVLDGETELATMQLNDETSVPRRTLNEIAATLSNETQLTDVKAAIAVAMCIEHAWAALDQYILLVVNANPSEIDGIQNAVAQESRAMLNRILANVA